MARTLLGLLAASLLAAPAAAAPRDSALVARGHALVLHNCGGCHAVGVRGDSPLAEAPRFRELGRRYPIDNLSEALAEGILTGHPAMPEFSFPTDDVAAIIAYLKSIQVAQSARR